MFEEYFYYSLKVIERDETLSKYESDMYNKGKYIHNLLVNTSPFLKIVHPIKLLRTVKEDKRIKSIKKAYYDKKNAPLPEFFVEESGELDHDFYAAATTFKPEKMREFAGKNPIYRKQDKKLLKKR